MFSGEDMKIYIKIIAIIVITGFSVFTACNGSSSSKPDPDDSNIANSNADLSALTVDSGTLSPSFNASIKSYIVNVSNSVTGFTATGTAADPDATVSYTPSMPVSLSVGTNNINVQVTAQDGTSIQNYKIVVFRNDTGGVLNLYAQGDGSGWAAMIQNMYLDSDGSSLKVGLKFNPIDGTNNNIWLLVDCSSFTSGLSDLSAGDPTGWGSLGITNSVSASIGFAYSGARSDLATNRAAWQWTSGSSHTDVSSFITITSDTVNGYYIFNIPYSVIGSGAASGNSVRVYALYGLNAAGGGIHSAAPEQSQTQITQMNAANAPGLNELDTVAPEYILQ